MMRPYHEHYEILVAQILLWSNRLLGPHLRVRRCEYYLGEINDRISRHIKSGSHKPTFHDNGNCISIALNETHQLDSMIFVTLTDVVTGLRSSLDYIAFDLLSSKEEKCIKNCYFPIGKDRKECLDMLKKSIPNVTKEVKDIIVDKIQPFKGGNGDCLWILHKLRNICSHRYLFNTLDNVIIEADIKVGDNGIEGAKYIFRNNHINLMPFSINKYPNMPEIFVDIKGVEYELNINENFLEKPLNAISFSKNVVSYLKQSFNLLASTNR